MKNIFLASVATLLATAGFAQNTATVSQNGTSQTANASQTGSALTAVISQSGTPANNTNNLGVTIQDGRGHSATVNQNNGSTFNRAAVAQVSTNGRTGNVATISQSNGSGGSSLQTGAPGSAVGTEGNWAGVAQVGSGNSASIIADGTGTKANFGEVWQKGTTNVGIMSQSGGSINTAQIFQGDDTRGGTQVGTISEVSNNTAIVTQGKSSPTDPNYATQPATSVSNTAIVSQFSDANNAIISQGGLSNFYNPALGRATNSSATILQKAGTGGHDAQIYQGTEGGQSNRDQASIIQIGTTNSATSVQGVATAGPINGSTDDVIVINQSGSLGTVLVTQGQVGVASSSTGTVTQTSASVSGTAYIFQGFGAYDYSSNDKAGITQGGNTNFAQIVQGGATDLVSGAVSSGNSATITQADETSNGEALINQGRDGGSATGNTASINQISGNLNTALISQGREVSVMDGTGAMILTNATVTNSTATVTQSGDNNIGRLYQAGSGHIATLTQTGSIGGSGNSTLLYQVGADGVATISQTGNGNVLDGGVAGSVAIQNGIGNTLTVTQTQTGSGAANVAHLNQSGNMNTIVVTQNNGMTVTP